MTGLTRLITSPSRSTTSRSTPWVLGCCGPKFTVRISPSSPGSRVCVTVIPWAAVGSGFISAMIRCSERSSLGWRRLPDLVVLGEVHRLTAHREVTAKGVAEPVLRHQDPRQVGVALELDAEHV